MSKSKPIKHHILVVDVESTCWDNPVDQGSQPNEIIEIGIAELNVQTGKISRAERLLVRPERSTISSFCTELTGIKDSDFDRYRTLAFSEACQMLRNDFNARKRIFASWGDYDRIQFERQCRSRGLAYPFGRSHLNVKDLFAIMHGRRKGVNVMHALEELDMEFEGRWHCGCDDAYNIARILKRLVYGRKV